MEIVPHDCCVDYTFSLWRLSVRLLQQPQPETIAAARANDSVHMASCLMCGNPQQTVTSSTTPSFMNFMNVLVVAMGLSWLPTTGADSMYTGKGVILSGVRSARCSTQFLNS